jgi:transposase
MYRTGKYSYQQIADMKALSKGTVINIVKGYPYNKDKGEYYHKLQEQSETALQEQITKVEHSAKSSYEQNNYNAYGMHMQQLVILMQAVSQDQVYEYIKDMRQRYEQQAWQAFSESNYSGFGYYADTWTVLTDILGDNMKNPWKLVALKINARNHSHSVKYTVIGFKGQNDGFCPMGQNSFREVSDETWQLIRPIFKSTTAGRHAEDRKTFNGIMYAFTNCRSLRSVPSIYGSDRNLRRNFADWYRAGVFSDLLQFTDVCTELQAVRSMLLDIEMHSLVRGKDIIPRLCDIQKRAGILWEKKTK